MKKKKLLELAQKTFPHFESKKIYALILCGEILANGSCYKDPKVLLPIDSIISLKQKKYVSRGGGKLEGALTLWDLKQTGEILLDAGCSTGGFTDCLLQHGASKVYAVDVGYNLLDYSLRNDKRVEVMERTNIMSIDTLDPQPAWAVADLSFRSIRSAASHIMNLTRDKKLIALMKPQFEWSQPDSDFDGIIRDPKIIYEVASNLIDELEEEGAFVHKLSLSPVIGRKGNQELLLWLSLFKEFQESKEVLLDSLAKALCL